MGARSTAKTTKGGKGSGARRRYRGHTVLPSGAPRSHLAQPTTKAAAGYTVNDTQDKNFGTTGTYSGNPGLGKYKRSMPPGRTKYVEA